MFGRTLLRVLAVVILAGLLVALGAGIYTAGLNAGATSVSASGAVVAPVHVVTYGWGFGGAIFGFFGFLLLLFLVIGLLRFAFWGGRGRGHGWGGRYYGGWGGPYPTEGGERPCHPAEAMLDDWHRRAHGEPPGTESGRQQSPPSS
jgi:hypothetical protein